ncbi:hypothetical protein N431DRAFT_553915 [Stipitochalara longipes BDJ]|nr:hypothetical protein N431DRAFT_553915 [Stipitochalara longipes BDJ]
MRRKAASPEKARINIKWSEDDTVELLANLELVVKRIRENSGWAGKKEVLQKLQPRLRRPRTVNQIENKLKSLNGSERPKTVEDVYRHGISRMQSLDVGLKLKVQEEIRTIKSKEVCVVVSTPRQLRSGSQNLGVEASRSKRGSTIFVERTPTRSMPRTRREEPEDLASKFDENKSLPRKTPRSWDTPRQRFLSRLTTTPSCASIADTEERIKSSQSSDTCREGDTYEDCSLNTPSLRNALKLPFYATELQDTPTIDYDDPNTIKQIPEQAILDRSHETLRDLFNDNLYFRKKWSDSEERRGKLDRNQRLRHSLLAPGSADVLQTMADTIEIQNEKINTLQRQLGNQKILQQFLMLGKGEEVPLNQSQIQNSHKKMRREFRSLSIMDCFQHPGETSACIESQDLNELKSKVSIDVHSYPVGLVIQSFTGAAVCEWVFNEKIQCTAMMSSPLLEGYRCHLGTICGELALRNVDLAAHQWVIDEDKHFQEQFLPRTAAKLADRLLNALGPFIKHKGKSEAKLKIRLESIFCAALNIKTFAMIGKNVFECIWPAHDSVFEKTFMEEDSSEGTTGIQDSSKQRGKMVMLALVPGLRVYRYDRKLVDYCGFTRGGEEGLEQPSLVAQAVVMAQ